MFLVTLLPLLVHITISATAYCYLEHAMPMGLCFLLGPSPGALGAHGQGWVLSPPPFKSAAPKMTYAFCCSAQNPQKELLSPRWAQSAKPHWAPILLETPPFAQVPFPSPGFAVQEGVSGPKQCPHSSSVG